MIHNPYFSSYRILLIITDKHSSFVYIAIDGVYDVINRDMSTFSASTCRARPMFIKEIRVIVPGQFSFREKHAICAVPQHEREQGAARRLRTTQGFVAFIHRIVHTWTSTLTTPSLVTLKLSQLCSVRYSEDYIRSNVDLYSLVRCLHTL